MKIGITGASGMLGSALLSRLSKTLKVFATSKSIGVNGQNIDWICFDLTDFVLLNQWLEKSQPDVIVHCAALVNVDLCEETVSLATNLHVKTTEVIANYINSKNGTLIYISTDSVFDGEKLTSYNENDLVNPQNIYAKTKLMGEELVLSINNGLVLRTNIVGWTKKGNTSFVEWILKSLVENTPLNLFHDVYFSPLTVDELSLIIEKIIYNPIYGLYHCGSNDSISKYNFGKKMAEIFEISDFKIKSISVDEMNFKAKRPKNMTLNSDKLSNKLKYNIPGSVDSIIQLKNQYYTRFKNYFYHT